MPIVLTLFVGLGIHLSLEPLYTPTALLTPSDLFHFPQLIAHKAIISGDFQGNTQEAIQEALASSVDGIEVDVRHSQDHVLYLYHGETLQESTNGQGKPEERTWDELSKLSYQGENPSPLVKLDDFLAVVGTQKFIFLDVKADGIIHNKALAKNVAQLIEKHHLQHTVFVESFNPFFLTAMRSASRDIMVMYDFTENIQASGKEVQSQFDKIPWILRQSWVQKQIRRIVRPDVLGPRYNSDPKILKGLIKKGYPLIIWTVDDPAVARGLYQMGIRGIQTNKPLDLLNVLPEETKVVSDAGGTKERVHEVIHIKTQEDIVKAIEKARLEKRNITIAGRRHSMGGQTLLTDSIHLDMLGFDRVIYNPQTKTLTAQAGATWKKIQVILDQNGRSIRVMQSDNIFTVGGSVSVNVHGWQVGDPPIGSTIHAMTVITADGKVRRIAPDEEQALFRAVIGGYGMYGVIVDVELKTTENTNLIFQSQFMKPKDLAHRFEEHVTNNPRAELAYARLSVDQSSLFEEAGLFWYERTQNSGVLHPIKPENLIAVKRAIFRVSQYSNVGKKVRWSAEKLYADKLRRSGPLSRNNAMNTDIHILWPLYGRSKDVLQEYFVPKQHLSLFIEAFKKCLEKHRVNILNVTVREVRRDTLSALPYASQNVFGLVCLFSQKQTKEDEERMEKFTQDAIDVVIALEGTFYLPYRLHYKKEQLLGAYPHLAEWIQLKKTWDPEGVFNSKFFQHLEAEVNGSVGQSILSIGEK